MTQSSDGALMDKAQNEALRGDCTQCGACREVCLAEALGGHTITSLLSGGQEYSAWLCSFCWQCQEACPQGVDIHAVMVRERRGEGRGEKLAEPALGPYRRCLESILRSGLAFSIGEEVASLRAAYGLPPLQPISAERLAALLGSLRHPAPDVQGMTSEVAACARD